MLPRPSYEQRRFPRVPLHCPVKLLADDLAPRSVSGQTCNVSAGGVCVEFPAELTPKLPIGARVSLALPSHPRQALITTTELLRGTIVRTTPATHSVSIAFDRPVTLALTAGSRVASRTFDTPAA